MRYKKTITGALVTISLVAVVVVLPQGRSLICWIPVNPYELNKAILMEVPENDQRVYIDRLRHVFEREGMGEESFELFLRGPDTPQYGYTIRTYVGCNGSSILYSSNDGRRDEFYVTFHYNRLFGRAAAESAEKSFIEEFEGTFPMQVGGSSGEVPREAPRT